MESVLAVSGVGLDKAWRQFDKATGTRLRAWSVELLNAVVDAAYENEVGALLFVGDLFDRVTARPSTVSDVRALLSGIDKAVVILPGADDWIGPGSPYDYLEWDGVDVVGSAVPMRLDALQSWSAAGITRPMGSPDAAILRSVGTAVFASPAVSPELASLSSAHIVTNGELFDTRTDRTYLPRLANPSGVAVGALIEETGSGVSVVPLELGSSPVHLTDIDVSDFSTTAELTTLLTTAATANEFTLLRLVGTVRQDVLIPGFSDWVRPAGVTVDVSALQYVEATSPTGDAISADVQFLRAMATLGESPTARHQATALGLFALSEGK